MMSGQSAHGGTGRGRAFLLGQLADLRDARFEGDFHLRPSALEKPPIRATGGLLGAGERRAERRSTSRITLWTALGAYGGVRNALG